MKNVKNKNNIVPNVLDLNIRFNYNHVVTIFKGNK